jgi:hypothetical protein
LQEIRRNCAILAILLSAAACKPAAESGAIAASGESTAHRCGDEGFLVAEIYGAISLSLDWSGANLTCEGMPRPEGQGARLRFAGSVDERPIAIIVAMPELTPESAGAELASNVTLIEEGSGRFYSTADLDVCLTQIDAMEALDDGANHYSVTGSVYCVSPLAEVNGDSSISVNELGFSGLLDWSAS